MLKHRLRPLFQRAKMSDLSQLHFSDGGVEDVDQIRTAVADLRSRGWKIADSGMGLKAAFKFPSFPKLAVCIIGLTEEVRRLHLTGLLDLNQYPVEDLQPSCRNLFCEFNFDCLLAPINVS